MALEWMGKYRAYVEAMVRYGNAYAQAVNIAGVMEDPPITSAQLQVLEYILENETRHDNMASIAARLQISQSSFSKIAKQLVTKNLLERYHLKNNKKEVILQVTDHGREIYEQYATGPRTEVWRKSFAMLDTLDENTVQLITHMLDLHADYLYNGISKASMQEDNTPVLVKIQD